MVPDTPLIALLVAGLALAFLLGLLAHRLKLPPLLGYLVAGLVVGPHVTGFGAEPAMAAELAELGVVLLLFGVGLHLSFRDLLGLRVPAIAGALLQLAVATALGTGLGLALGWPGAASLLFGLALAAASRVGLLAVLRGRRLLDTEEGRFARDWLLVQDLVMVLALVLLPALLHPDGAGSRHDPFVSLVETIAGLPVGFWGVLALTLLKLAAFIGFMLVVGQRLVPWLLGLAAARGNRELLRLAIIALALGVAWGAALLFGAPLALGALLAGMILGQDARSRRATGTTLPLREAFAVPFFVAVGMLVDPLALLAQPLPLLAALAIVLIVRPLLVFGIALAFGRPVAGALTLAAGLAQIGEFSYVLAAMGVALALLPAAGENLVFAVLLLSLVLNPLAFRVAAALRPRLETRFGPPPVATPVEPVLTPTPESAPASEGLDKPAAMPDKAPEPPEAPVTAELVAIEPAAAAPEAPVVDGDPEATPSRGEAPPAIDEVLPPAPPEAAAGTETTTKADTETTAAEGTVPVVTPEPKGRRTRRR